ncbi:MAG: TlpA disulfide reductase family protein [Pseudomonadota bacterium]
MKQNKLPFAAIAVIFAGIGIYFGIQRLEPEAPHNAAVANFYSQSMPDAQGTMRALSQWKGKTLVVNFWATWCAPCVDEMPELVALQTEVASKNTQIIGIGIDSAANIREFGSKYKISYPLYSAGMVGTDLSRQFGNQAGGLPFTVLITADGKVKKTYLGRLNMKELRNDLGSL